MASGMKLWSVIVVLLCAGVVWLALPPRPAHDVMQAWGWGMLRNRSPEEQHRNRLQRAVRRANAALRTVRWEDSLTSMVLEHGTTGLWVGLPDDRPEEEVASVRRSLAEEIAPDAPGQAAVGVAFIPASVGGWPGIATLRLSGYYFGRGPEGTAYCVAARGHGGPPGSDDVSYRVTAGRSMTGLCRWIHRYGLPGDAVSGWLTTGGTLAASGLEPYGGQAAGALNDDIRARRRGTFGIPGGLDLITSGGSFAWSLSPARDRCLAGIPEACVETVTPTPPPDGPGPSNTAFQAVEGWSLWLQDAYLMITLEEAFGPERLQAFWSSDAPLTEAFEAAFGEPMGPWLLGWYGEHTEVVPPGPAPRLAGLLSALAILLLAGAASGLFVGRWSVTG